MSIENEFHYSRGFRKIHLELAIFGSSLEILHCVFFPDPCFDIPIFGVDIVANKSNISAAIVDLSPVSEQLPKLIFDQLSSLSLPVFSKVRTLPDWGDIFSPFVSFVSPITEVEKNNFISLVDSYLSILISYMSSVQPQSRHSNSTIERYRAQQYYCQRQKLNDKTRNVLSMAFSKSWADQYIEKALFHCPSLF